MTGIVSETSVEEMARFLQDKKSRGQRVKLLVGHRAGALSNDNLHQVLMRYAMTPGELAKLLRPGAPDLSRMAQHIQSLDNLSASDKFGKYYNFLGRNFSESAIHDILLSALAPARCREEDELMARLIQIGLFDTIINTNIDTLLEDACVLLGMKEGSDYQVFRCADYNAAPGQGSSRYGQIVKVFGDLDSLKYKTAGNEFDLEANQPLKRFLLSELAKDTIVLGYDPTWDRPIDWAFQETGGALWYVNEEPPVKLTRLAHVLNEREGKYLAVPQGSYRSFLRVLCDLIGGGTGREMETGSSPPLAQSQNPARDKAFISYSHKDEESLKRLQVHLRGYLYAASAKETLDMRVVAWDDTKIPLGADWEKEIKEALVHAKVAALLVSADFLASDYIRENEIPVLLKAAQAGEVTILCVVLSPCAFQYTSLARYQVMNHAEPLMGMEPYKQEVVWAKLAEQIFNILNPQTTPVITKMK